MARFMWGAARGSNRRLRSEDASTSTTSVNSIPYAIRVRDHPQSSTVSIAREKSSGVRARAHPRTGSHRSPDTGHVGQQASRYRMPPPLANFISSKFEPRSRPKIFWCGRYNRPQVVPVPHPARRPIDHVLITLVSGSRFEPVVSSCDGDAVEDAKPQSPPLTHRTQQTHLHLPEHTRAYADPGPRRPPVTIIDAASQPESQI